MGDEILQDFLAECWENLSQLDQTIVLLEQQPADSDRLAAVFRTVHTIKGTCGYLELNRLGQLTHSLENALGKMRSGQLAVNSTAISVVLEGIDRIKEFLQGLEATQEEPQLDSSQLIHRLNQLASPEELADRASPSSCIPTAENQTSSMGSPAKNFTTRRDAMHHEAGKHETRKLSSELTVRVNVHILDALMNLAGELALTRNQLLDLARGEDESKYAGPLSQLSRLTAQLQEKVTKARMQSAHQAWGNFSRMVRDLSRVTGKPMEFELQGENIELDRSILEALRDPLTHMIRNSADHGIERAQERRSAGKPDVGRIRLHMLQETNQIIISLEDDGAGIPRAKILQKALGQGVITESEAERLSEQDIINLVFQPGLSTAEQVTAVSGRGVGMDIVRTAVERIGGAMEIRSTAGQGTHIRIRIPLTMAVISVLVVECADQTLGIPQLGIVEVLQLSGEERRQMESVHGRCVLHRHDRVLPLIDLREVLQIPESSLVPAGPIPVIVLQVGDEQFGLQVDQVRDAEQIVVKPLDESQQHKPYFQGTGTLGDGRIVMVLDTTDIAGRLGDGSASLHELRLHTDPPDASGDLVELLRFRNLADELMAVPLAFVVRVEELTIEQPDLQNGCLVALYHGRWLPLLGASTGEALEIRPQRHTVIVCTDKQQTFGIIAQQIVGIVKERFTLPAPTLSPGFLGSAVIAGEMTHILDVPHCTAAANNEAFRRIAVLPPKKVLVIDDSMFFRQLIRKAVESHGYRAVTADGAEQAVDMLQQGTQFDAVLCDIEMPGMNGCQFAEWCRGQPQTAQLPLVAITSLDAGVHGERILGAGFDRMLIKFHSQQLRDTLADLLPDSGCWLEQSA